MLVPSELPRTESGGEHSDRRGVHSHQSPAPPGLHLRTDWPADGTRLAHRQALPNRGARSRRTFGKRNLPEARPFKEVITAFAAFGVYELRPMSLGAHDTCLCIGADFQSIPEPAPAVVRIRDNHIATARTDGYPLLLSPKRPFFVTIAVRPTGSVFGGLVQCTICELNQQG